MDLSYVGIDIAKAKLDSAVRPSGHQWVSAHPARSGKDI